MQDALLASIAETEKQTELATRVSTWKQKIEHNLEEQVGSICFASLLCQNFHQKNKKSEQSLVVLAAFFLFFVYWFMLNQ